MQYNHFIKLTKSSEPSDELKGIHLSLWYAVKDDWDLAHSIVQDINSETASRIHAYLHRVAWPSIKPSQSATAALNRCMDSRSLVLALLCG
jgi:hypothetical protein